MVMALLAPRSLPKTSLVVLGIVVLVIALYTRCRTSALKGRLKAPFASVRFVAFRDVRFKPLVLWLDGTKMIRAV